MVERNDNRESGILFFVTKRSIFYDYLERKSGILFHIL